MEKITVNPMIEEWLSSSFSRHLILLYFFLLFFQFLTFAERLANVNIDVIHRIDRTGAYAEVGTAGVAT